MPRSNRPRRGGRPLRPADAPAERPLGAGMQRVESHADGDWVVRPVTGSGGAGKSYRCPGCDQLVPAGTAHVVAWPADGLTGPAAAVEDRRHWHRPCWDSRDRRGARVARRPPRR